MAFVKRVLETDFRFSPKMIDRRAFNITFMYEHLEYTIVAGPS